MVYVHYMIYYGHFHVSRNTDRHVDPFVVCDDAAPSWGFVTHLRDPFAQPLAYSARLHYLCTRKNQTHNI